MKIFVTGNSRSGTTMMGRVLNNHTLIHTFQELHFFDEMVSEADLDKGLNSEMATELFSRLLSVEREGYFGSRNIEKYKDESSKVLHGAEGHTGREIYGLFLNYITHSAGMLHSCDQTPQNIFYAQEILNTFKDAKVVVMVRDPRDVLLSQKNKWKRKKLSGDHFPLKESIRAWINYHPFTISRLWSSVMNEASSLRDDTRVLKVRFEDLTADPENTVKRVCYHLSITYQPSMLKVPKVGSSNIEDTDTEHTIDASRSGRWKQGDLNNTEIFISESINKKHLLLNRYEYSSVSFNFLVLIYYLLTFPVKSMAAVFFNLHRLRDPVRVLKRLFG
jgi:hypothetical protein